jgi:hypothetical protein
MLRLIDRSGERETLVPETPPVKRHDGFAAAPLPWERVD